MFLENGTVQSYGLQLKPYKHTSGNTIDFQCNVNG